MNRDTDDRLTTEQYADMYRNLPRDSHKRRQIERLLRQNHEGTFSQSSQSDVNTESNTLSHYQHPFDTGFSFGGFPSFDRHFSLMSQHMDNQFNRMREEMRNTFSQDLSQNSDEEGNYSFSKRTSSHTFVGDDGEKYTKTSVKTNKYNNGEHTKSSKNVFKKGDNEVQFIKHNDGREQVVGNRDILNDFPENMRNLSGYKLINGKH